MKRFNKFLMVPLIAVFVLGLTAPAMAATTTVNLGTAGNFAVLAGTGITNTGATTIAGDVGSSAIDTQTGFETVTFSSGANHTIANPNDATTQGAKLDLTAAYIDAAGRTGAIPIVGGDLGGRTLTAGVYKDNNDPDALALTGTLTLDAQGDTNAVWIFQSGSTLTTASGSRVVLINGAQSCNVFWQVTSSATLGTTTAFVGNVLALISISLTDGATVNGRLLAQNGAVTLIHNTVTAATCTTPSAEAAEAAAAYTAKTAAAAEAAASTQAAALAATKLPSTGVAPSQNSASRNIAMLAGIFAVSTLLIAIRRKKRALK